MGRTSKENLNLKKDEQGAYIQPWAWLIGCKVAIVDYDDKGQIVGIALEKEDLINPYTDKPHLYWIGYHARPVMEDGHFFIL